METKTGISYFAFYKQVRGYKFYDQKGKEVDKWELFFRGVNPKKLIANKTKYNFIKIVK